MYTQADLEMALKINKFVMLFFLVSFIGLAILEMIPGFNNWLFSLFGGAL